MTLGMARIESHGVTTVSLYPGLVRTEAVLAAKCFDEQSKPGVHRSAIRHSRLGPNIRVETAPPRRRSRGHGVTDVDRHEVGLELRSRFVPRVITHLVDTVSFASPAEHNPVAAVVLVFFHLGVPTYRAASHVRTSPAF